jgi:hypothetical protein
MGTLTFDTTVIDLSDDLAWPGEFAWPAVAQKKTYSVTGALYVEAGLKKAGRTIVLQTDESNTWLSRTDVAALRALTEIPGAAMVLVFREQTFNVNFDHEAGAIESQPVVDFSDPDDADFCTVVLRFITV